MLLHALVVAVLLATVDSIAVQQNKTTGYRWNPTKPRVWLYSLVAADYEGAKLLPHWIEHYTRLGLPWEFFVLDVLHDPDLDPAGLKAVTAELDDRRIMYRVLEFRYTPDLQDRAMLFALSQFIRLPEDWIIVADSDEFFTYGHDSVYDAVQEMEWENATYALGEMLDRVAEHGVLKTVSDTPDIWDQYPLMCPLVAEMGKGLPVKVTIHRAYLRSGAGHHHIVDSDWAEAYFGEKCSGRKCDMIMKRFKQRAYQDLLMATPYLQWAHRYAVTDEDGDVVREGWKAQQWSKWTKVHHFKWHSGVVGNLKFRMERDSGDCRLHVNEHNCSAAFPFWKEVATQYHSLRKSPRINVTAMGCKTGVDTFWSWRR